MTMSSIDLRSVSVRFPIYGNDRRALYKEVIRIGTGGLLSRDSHQRVVVTALDDINLNLRRGDRIALIGHNGAGKSTLLRVLAGIYQPTVGTIAIQGHVASLFDVGLGMDPDSTGVENIRLRGALLGLTQGAIEERMAEIAEFCDLGTYLDMPIRTYSSGMLVRLAFAISTAISPDILLIDEVMGAGDATFMHRAQMRINRLIDKASILVLASHSPQVLKRFCDKGILLHHGRAIAYGWIDDILHQYAEMVEMAQYEGMPHQADDDGESEGEEGETSTSDTGGYSASYGLDEETARIEVSLGEALSSSSEHGWLAPQLRMLVQKLRGAPATQLIDDSAKAALAGECDRALMIFEAALRLVPPPDSLAFAMERIARALKAPDAQRRYALLIDRFLRRHPSLPYLLPPAFVTAQRRAQKQGRPPIPIFFMPESDYFYVVRRLGSALGTPNLNVSINTFPAEDFLIPALVERAAAGGAIACGAVDANPFNLDVLRAAGCTRISVLLIDPRHSTHTSMGINESVLTDGSWSLEALGLPADWRELSFDSKVDWYIDHRYRHLLTFIEGWLKLEQGREDFQIHISTWEDLAADEGAFFNRLSEFHGIEWNNGGASVEAGRFVPPPERWRQSVSAQQQDRMTAMIPPEWLTRFGWH